VVVQSMTNTDTADAKAAVASNDPHAKHEAIGHAMGILVALQDALEQGVSGELSRNLDCISDHLLRRLQQAGNYQDQGILDEVLMLMSAMKDGWNGIRLSS